MTEDTKDIAVEDVLADEGTSAEPETYEVAFHILPTVSDEDLSKEVAALVDALKKQGAELVGERFPSKIKLAYEMEKKIDGSIERFSEAYFGWVAGVLSKDAIAEVIKSLDNNPSVLRYLVTKTSKDAVAAIMSDPTLDVSAPEEETPEEELADDDIEAPEGGEDEEKAA